MARFLIALGNLEPMFLPLNKKEEEFLMGDKRRITVMTKLILLLTGACTSLWTLSSFLKRIQDPDVQLHIYLPFDTDTWFRYSIAVIIYTCLANLWNGYGHISFDCAIAAYYSQAHTQLKIIRYNLERLTDDNDSLEIEDIPEGSRFQYRDMVDPNIKEQFVYIVRKYEKVTWYTEAVGEILDKLIGFGFLSTCFGVCISVSIISSADTSFPLMVFQVSYSVTLLSQVFLYCFFGNLVTNESSMLNTSIYMSDWYTLSPGFRRGILIAMERWLRPLVPRVNSFVVVPLSLSTFIMLVKSTYSLYTVLKAAKTQ